MMNDAICDDARIGVLLKNYSMDEIKGLVVN